MDHIGIDVHKRDSQISILAEGGEVIEQRIRREGERFAAVLGVAGPVDRSLEGHGPQVRLRHRPGQC